MKLKNILLIFFLIPTLTLAKTLTPSEKLENSLSMWETLSADFTQTISDINGKQLHKFTGRLYIHKPDRFRWIVKSPEPQTIVSDGRNLWIYDEELEQVTIQPLNEQLSETPAMFLSGEFNDIAAGFNISMLKSEDKEQKFLLTPKNEDNLIERIEITFDIINFNLKQLKIRDALQQTTFITFTDVRDNPELSEKIFTFVPPQNVDVIGEVR